MPRVLVIRAFRHEEITNLYSFTINDTKTFRSNYALQNRVRSSGRAFRITMT